ncbi:hypothetical protein A9P82_03465 [Arachidicoccus ginsenosidimutans]|uniref:glycosyltransferase n=1 Tax=Arachidicoccus sp. BS20 TaxID=1850526 RepID=UPI0007F1378D|nr:glycosyltransferase [Arachidicoccus sp. BS20]ANI88443.1 hypothetical protein A9P82_03465 [Arachidicoccus sp. BS20]
MSKKTLVILTPAFPLDASNQESIWVPAKQRLIKCINRNFPDLEIIVLSFQFPVSKNEYYWNGNLVIPFAGANKNGMTNKLLWIKVFNKLRSLNKQKKIIGLLSFWCAECAFVAHYFSKLYRIKHLCWISGQDAKRENKFVKRIRPKPEELVAMSDFLMDKFYENHHIRPAHLIPNAIDTQQFQLRKSSRTIDIIGVGGLSPLKQYDVFVDIVAELKKVFPDINVYLCGDGLERERLELQIEKLNLTQNITLTGKLSQEEIFDLLQQSKVLLHTSNYEGFSNVCLEALYAGAHVVSFIKAMNSEISHWHKVSTKEEMMQKTLHLLNDSALEHESVLLFDMGDTARKFMQLFSEK